MVRGTPIRRVFILLTISAALVLPATANADPVATKSGTLINYVSTGKLKIGKRISIVVVCSTNCNVDSTTVIVGPGPNLTAHVSGPLNANVPGGPFFNPNGPLLKAMKADPGKYKIRSSLTATSTTTGASETISRTFKLKR